MRGLLIFLAIAVVSVSAAFKPGLRVKFNVGLRPGTDFFYEVPRTVADAVKNEWTITNRPPGSPRASLVLYCPADLSVCGLYDTNGIVSGLQVAVIQNDVTESVYDWNVQGFVEWTPTSLGEAKKYWAQQQYFVSEEYLQRDAAERLDEYDDTRLLQEKALWLTGFNGVIDKVSSVSSDIENSIFTRQACIPWMGRHYYYNMTADTPCRADTLYPWFPLVHSGELVATGLIMYGKLGPQKTKLDWFENPGKLAVQVIVPNGPECLYNLAGNPGLITLHIYYINTPWVLGCLTN